MFGVGPALGTYAMMPVEVLADLEKIYQKARRATAKAVEKSNKEVNKYVKQLLAKAAAGQQTSGQTEAAADADGNAPTGQHEEGGIDHPQEGQG